MITNIRTPTGKVLICRRQSVASKSRRCRMA